YDKHLHGTNTLSFNLCRTVFITFVVVILIILVLIILIIILVVLVIPVILVIVLLFLLLLHYLYYYGALILSLLNIITVNLYDYLLSFTSPIIISKLLASFVVMC